MVCAVLVQVELVQKMIDGVTKVIELEEMLASGKTADDVRAYLANPSASASAPPPPPASGSDTMRAVRYSAYTATPSSSVTLDSVEKPVPSAGAAACQCCDA